MEKPQTADGEQEEQTGGQVEKGIKKQATQKLWQKGCLSVQTLCQICPIFLDLIKTFLKSL